MKRTILGIAVAVVALASSAATARDPGDWVLAQWRGDIYWFPGVVERDNGSTISVRYDDGTREARPSNQVKTYDWRIGSAVECRWSDGNWYGARITQMGADGESLTIRYVDDGVIERTKTGKCRSR